MGKVEQIRLMLTPDVISFVKSQRMVGETISQVVERLLSELKELSYEDEGVSTL